VLLIRRFEEKRQSNTKSKIRGFCICILAKKWR
jgi:hypothetical protein